MTDRSSPPEHGGDTPIPLSSELIAHHIDLHAACQGSMDDFTCPCGRTTLVVCTGCNTAPLVARNRDDVEWCSCARKIQSHAAAHGLDLYLA